MTKINAEGTARGVAAGRRDIKGPAATRIRERVLPYFFQLKTLPVENKKVIFDLEASIQ